MLMYNARPRAHRPLEVIWHTRTCFVCSTRIRNPLSFAYVYKKYELITHVSTAAKCYPFKRRGLSTGWQQQQRSEYEYAKLTCCCIHRSSLHKTHCAFYIAQLI